MISQCPGERHSAVGIGMDGLVPVMGDVVLLRIGSMEGWLVEVKIADAF